MARRYSKKHLFWLLPLTVALLLVVALAVGLSMARQHGWNWQGLAWDEGPVLERLVWRDGGCLRLDVRDIHLRDAWPVRLSVASVTVPSCADSAQTSGGAGFALPLAPPFDVVVDALRFRDYPALRVAVHHRGSRWWAQASIKGSDLQAAYDAASGLWQMSGHVDVARLRGHLSGTLNVHGSGYWHPGANEADERFGGQLRITGAQLGQAQGGPRGNLTASLAWQGQDWTLDAALDQPVALGQGWVLQSGQGMHASGAGLTVREATADLAAEGPQGRALLSLRSHARRLGSGQGSVVLSHGLSGRIDFSWTDGRLVVQPFAVTGPNHVILALDEAAAIPLALEGQTAPAMTVRYGEAAISTTESHLSWSGSGVRWHGAVAFDGRLNGYQLNGGWSGAIGSDGLQGEPLVAILDGANLHVRARLPVVDLWPPDWPVVAQLDGRFMGQDFTATVSAAQTDAGWGGDVQARSRLPQMDQGGALALRGQWQWRDGLVLSSGTQLTMAQALKGSVVIQPIELVAVTPVTVSAKGIHGRFRLDADGMTTARWRLPPLHGDLALDGWRVDADFRIPGWNATLSVAGRDLAGTPRGTFRAELPLQPAVSRGLGFIVRDGMLTANGQWRVGNALKVTGRLRARDAKLDWGSISARGVQADLDVSWRSGEVRISTRAPLNVARLDTGVPFTDITLGLNSDLQTWRFHDIEASVLGGRLTANALTWPSSDYQPVVLTDIDVAQLAALQSKPVVKVSGQVGGTIPLRLERHSVAIRNGRLQNETPLMLSIPQTEGVIALKKTNQAVDMALDALSPLRIEELSARINMSADGWLKAAMTIKGFNPRRKLPIVLNYTHQENMFELLRSLRIGDRVIDAVTDN